MEQSTKDLWIQKLKQGRVLVIQSALAPLKKDCLWFKNGALYVYGNRGWEDLGVGDGGDDPTPEPEPEPEPSDRVYVPVPTELNSFGSITYEYDNPTPIKGEAKGETKSSETKTLPVSSTIVPDNAAGFEVTENLCIPITGTYEVIDRSLNPFSFHPYWYSGCDPNDIPEVDFYYNIIGIMNAFYDPSEYELLHYDRFWDSDRHFQVDTWTAKVMERGSRAKIERTRLFVTMELDPETTTIEDTSVMFYINDAILA